MLDSGTNTIYSHTPWVGQGYNGNNDIYIKESEFNAIMERLGLEPADCSNGFYIVAKYEEVTQFDYSDIVLENGGMRCKYSGMLENIPFFFYGYMCAVVPDDFAVGLETEYFFRSNRSGERRL